MVNILGHCLLRGKRQKILKCQYTLILCGLKNTLTFENFSQSNAGDMQAGADSLETPDPGQHADTQDPHMDTHPGTRSRKSMP